jgi:hypothetical protein
MAIFLHCPWILRHENALKKLEGPTMDGQPCPLNGSPGRLAVQDDSYGIFNQSSPVNLILCWAVYKRAKESTYPHAGSQSISPAGAGWM